MYRLSVIIIVVFFSIQILHAGDEKSSTSQTLLLEVKPVSSLVVAGSPLPLLIQDAVAGVGTASITDRSTMYSLTTNVDNMKIVASINEKMPAGTSLQVMLSSRNANSMGLVDVSNALTPVDVVTGIGKGFSANEAITYTFSASAETGEIPDQARTITLTLTN
jgi:hypothetical protein